LALTAVTAALVPASAGPTSLAIYIVAGVAVLPFVAIAGLNVYVAYRDGPPLTQVVEEYLRRYPVFAAALAAFCGALVGHVFWSFGAGGSAAQGPLSLLWWAAGLAVLAGVFGAALLAWMAEVGDRRGLAIARLRERLARAARPVTAPLAGIANQAELRRMVSVALMALAALVLLAVIAWMIRSAIVADPSTCSNPPSRTTSIPQLVQVGACVAAFVLGRVTARPKLDDRAQVSARSGQPAESKRIRRAIVAQASLTGALLLITWLFLFEMLTLAAGVWPITYYLRCANQVHPGFAVAGAAAFCLLAGRWMWLPATPREPDPEEEPTPVDPEAL
jgi:hypothetical protein